MKIIITLVIIGVIVAIVLYKYYNSPEKLLERGKFVKAYEGALKQLKKGKSSEKNTEILISALTEIITKGKADIKTSLLNESVKNKEKALQIIKSLVIKMTESSNYTNSIFEEENKSMKEEQELLETNVNTEYFEKGKTELEYYRQTMKKDNAQHAHSYFKKSKKYNNDSPDLDALIEESLLAAQKIYVINIDKSFVSKYAEKIDYNLKNLAENATEYIQVYFIPDTDKSKEVDCYIEIIFSHFDADKDENSEVDEIQKGISENGQSITVRAKKVTKKIVKTATWPVNIRVSGNQNCTIRDAKINEVIESKIEEVHYEGDKRAFPDNYDNRQNDHLMEDEEMAEQLIHKIYDKIKEAIF